MRAPRATVVSADQVLAVPSVDCCTASFEDTTIDMRSRYPRRLRCRRDVAAAAQIRTYRRRGWIVWTGLIALVHPWVASAQWVDLGTSAEFGVLAASAIQNTGDSVINGSLGISPNNASSISGFPPGIVIGATHAGDSLAAQAQNDVTTAYNNLAGRACGTLIGADLGASILTPGVYCSASSMTLTGELVLDAQNDPGAVFIFQMGTTLTTASGASVRVIHGGQNCNVFWQVGSSATLGTGTSFVGNILAMQSITLTTAASTSGRLLARNAAITLDANTISVCAAPPLLSVVKSVSPNPVVVGSSAVYTVVVSNGATQAQTLSDLIVDDNLPNDVTLVSSSGSDPGWICDGTQALVCSYSQRLLAGSATTLELQVHIGSGAVTGSNTVRVHGGGDPGCPAPPLLAAARCSASILATTVPVVLSDVDARVDAGVLTVRFGTLTEMAALGYRVLTGNAGLPSAVLDDTLVAATGAPMQPERYEIQGRYQGEAQVWIEEQTIDGRAIAYGPFPVGTTTGRRADTVTIDWAANAAELAAFRARQRRDLRASGHGVDAELSISADGWYVVRYEDLLAQGLDWLGASKAELKLRQGSKDVPLQHAGGDTFGPGSRLAFLGQAISGSQYTTTAVYRLSRESTGMTMETRDAAPTGAEAVTQVRARLRHAPQRGYLATASGADPWYALRLQRVGPGTAAASETFDLPGRALDSSNEHIQVEIWGGIDFPQSPDHSVRLLVNGRDVASVRFDGIATQLIEADLPPGLLSAANNTATLQLVADTGLSADLIMLDAISVDYQRELRVNADRFDFTLPADTPSSAVSGALFASAFEASGAPVCTHASDCDHYQVLGLSQPDPIVVRERAGSTVLLDHTDIHPADGGYRLDFASDRHPGDRYWIAPRGGSAPAQLTAQPQIADPLAGGPAQLLIIAHPSFMDGLADLVAARRAEGFSVRVLDVDSLYRRYSDGVIDPAAVQRAVADAYQRLGTRYVLLVGGDTYDYQNLGGSQSISFIPTHYRQTDRYVRYAPADSVAADIDADGWMDVAIGRLPVRNAAELANAIAKTLSYPQADHPSRLLLQSDRADRVHFDDQLATIGTAFGSAWTVTGLSLDNYPAGSTGTTSARLELASALDAGQALTVYLGHSAPDRWTFSGLLSAQDVYAGFFHNTARPTVLWNLGCYGAYFVEPNYQTIAHAMLLQDQGGAAAVLGASGLTALASDVAWINTVLLYLPQERLGDAMMLSQRLLRGSGSQFNDVSIGGNLLGDPTLRLNRRPTPNALAH